MERTTANSTDSVATVNSAAAASTVTVASYAERSNESGVCDEVTEFAAVGELHAAG